MERKRRTRRESSMNETEAIQYVPEAAEQRKRRIAAALSAELGITQKQAETVMELVAGGNTIPFIARYRKEATGGLNDEVLRAFEERLRYLEGLSDRREAVCALIAEQGKLTAGLLAKLQAAGSLVEVEDLYRPYKQKRRTRASIARERGLEPLAQRLGTRKPVRDRAALLELAAAYCSEEKGVPDAMAALAGARDILAEQISDEAAYRQWIRNRTEREGLLSTAAKQQDEHSVYAHYFAFEAKLSKLQGHQILAINRGEKEKALSVKLTAPREDILRYLERKVLRDAVGAVAEELRLAAADAYDRLIAPSVETELRNALTEQAESGAIHLFAENLRQLLMQPPMEGKVVLGWDPAFRTGCKLCVVDPTGKVLDTTVIYPTAPQERVAESLRVLKQLVQRYHVDVISLGNGTASRESEQVIASLLQEPEIRGLSWKLGYCIVNEAGASVYSASKLAAKEFPQFDVGQRSSASIARRLQDPLAELVKIEPKAIGVGQYQHDINQTRLSGALTAVVEDCVNRVGVDLNTASAALLSYISGISQTVAANIVAYREKNGRFLERKALLKVPKLGPKAFEQAAGFLRIREGSNPLDLTGVHPESYRACEALLKKLGKSAQALRTGGLKGISAEVPRGKARAELAAELGIGLPTLEDILAELEKPLRDPRADLPKPVLRSDILELKDLTPGMELRGTVRNVIDFGAFVDIGVHQDGLVHISELSDRFVKHPLDVVKVGDVVKVRVLSVDLQKKRIALSMKGVQQ